MTFGEAACRLAAVQLDWKPQEFWMATPAELLTCLGIDEAQGTTRDVLTALMRQFPDQER
jgi:uncharacterized phage protein (TIGR02216 family)